MKQTTRGLGLGSRAAAVVFFKGEKNHRDVFERQSWQDLLLVYMWETRAKQSQPGSSHGDARRQMVLLYATEKTMRARGEAAQHTFRLRCLVNI